MKLSEDEIKSRVLRAAAFVGVKPEHLEKSPFDLSGGEKRRVAIAGVMSMEPEVLIFDEPAAGLDPRGRKSLIGMISDITSKNLDMYLCLQCIITIGKVTMFILQVFL